MKLVLKLTKKDKRQYVPLLIKCHYYMKNKILFYCEVYQLLDIDECYSNPCQWNSTCTDRINGYVCENCPMHYTGIHCEIGKSSLSSITTKTNPDIY